ncbi:hypothetical protein F442_09061 [Phytophthora nicotianae P10297]|uniref:Uncharacterized protein n=1 Tax=Phytophthora nicotianae P10297 TaxID=1317064 RepID=W2ZBH5_PHYNI|nr:hypothetical protein F442_09061 [Phytophthora nicotianae P10297]
MTSTSNVEGQPLRASCSSDGVIKNDVKCKTASERRVLKKHRDVMVRYGLRKKKSVQFLAYRASSSGASTQNVLRTLAPVNFEYSLCALIVAREALRRQNMELCSKIENYKALQKVPHVAYQGIQRVAIAVHPRVEKLIAGGSISKTPRHHSTSIRSVLR